MDEIRQLQTEFGVSQGALRNVVQLIDDGNTIPFIARYRKEMTGSLDDQVLREIAERLAYLRGLQKRKEEVCVQIEAAGALDDTLRAQVAACTRSACGGVLLPGKGGAGCRRRARGRAGHHCGADFRQRENPGGAGGGHPTRGQAPRGCRGCRKTERLQHVLFI